MFNKIISRKDVQYKNHLVMATFLMPDMMVRLEGGASFTFSVRWGPYLTEIPYIANQKTKHKQNKPKS